MPSWLVFSLATALFWSIGQVLSKKGLRHISALWSNIFANIVGIFVWIPVVLFATNFHLTFPNPLMILLIFLTGVCYMSYFYAIAQGKLALTGTLFELYPIVTIFLSFFFLHERINAVQVIGILLTLIGGVCIAWPEKVGRIQEHAWIFWGLAGAALEGIGDFFAKVTVVHVGPYAQMFFLVILFQVVSVANYLLDKKGRKLPPFTLKNFLPSVIGNGLVVTGTAFLFFALEQGKASLVTPVTSISPALVVILAVLFLKERITKRQTAGIVAIIAGVVLVGFV